MSAAVEEETDEIGLETRATLGFAKLAIAARRDPAIFYGLVMREETTRDHIMTAAHQELCFEFSRAHDRCVIRMPVGMGKTYMAGAIGLWMLGTDCTSRGVIASASANQAQKPVKLVADTIEGTETPELRAVFPALAKGQRRTDKWTNMAITVDRPPGIRDASLTALGVGSKILGSRLSWIVVDDVLDEENTGTPEARRAVIEWFFRSVMSRVDPKNSRVMVTNTPWVGGDSPDLTYALEALKWPSLTMDCWGNVFIKNTDWDTDLVRPSNAFDGEDERGMRLRLTAHDDERFGAPRVALDALGRARKLAPNEPDPPGEEVGFYDLDDEIPLFPERFPRDLLLAEQEKTPPHVWAMHREMRVWSDEDGHCKREYIERCKQNARLAGIETLATRLATQGSLVITGVDIGVGLADHADRSALVTIELVPEVEVFEPNGRRVLLRNARRLLNVQSGRWEGGEIIDRIFREVAIYGSIVAVETNAAQMFIRQWAAERDVSVPVSAFTTGARNKHSRLYGVESLFQEFKQGAWLFPNREGVCDAETQRLVDNCLAYRPGRHTGDVLMACWIAREKMREKSRALMLGDSPVAMIIGSR